MAILFKNVTAVLMDTTHTVLAPAYVAVEGRTIASVGTTRPEGIFDREIDGKGGILMPGLINAHTHVPMTASGLLRLPQLQDWLTLYLPVEARWMTGSPPALPGSWR